MAQDPQSDGSVFDFLYVDTRRISQILAQFGDEGIITELNRSADETSELSGGIDIKIAKMGAKEGAKVSVSRKFDPQWLLPLNFLDATQERLARELTSAGIGQLVLVSGGLGVIDASLLSAIWDGPMVGQLLEAGLSDEDTAKLPNRAERRRTGRQQPTAEPASNVGGFLAHMIKIMPHVMQARIYTDDGDVVWSNLRPESLAGSSEDLFLKHGQAIAGRWNAVGIMDALPDHLVVDDMRETIEADIGSTPLGQLVTGMMPLMQSGFGRPATAYGMTPLLIFRELTGRS